MASRYLGNHRTRCDRLSNNSPLLIIAPPPATDDARDFRPAPNNLRVVTDVDHNVHTIRDPKRIASMQARSSFGYVQSEHRLPRAHGAVEILSVIHVQNPPVDLSSRLNRSDPRTAGCWRR
jgi:hypothetical protein